MLIGYARVSTQDQNLELQREALRQAGCQKVFEDQVSGTRAERPGLTKAQEMLREGDMLVVWKLDRLGRSVKQLVDLAGELQQRGVQFKSLTDAIDTGTPSGRFFFHVMASLAEMERDLIVERTRAGLEVARQLGRKGGAQAQDDRQQDSVGQEAAGQRHATQGRGTEPRRLGSDAVPLAAGLRFSTGLTYFAIRILKRPLLPIQWEPRPVYA